MHYLSGYRLLWLLVLFDLPVSEKKERRAATEFRNRLLDFGFEMSQFSVYMKWCYGYESAETQIKNVRQAVPPYGKVHILTFTDVQFKNMVTFKCGSAKEKHKIPDQYEMF